jgi:cytochrome c
MNSQFITLLVRPKSGGRWTGHEGHFLESRIVCLSAIALLVSSPGMSQDGALQIFNNACRTCHTTREGDNRLGPNLHNILGRKAGSLPDYNFSSAMKDAGFVWDEEKLERFIAHPDEVVPGNNMRPYGGLASAEDRAKVAAFLRSVTNVRPSL